MNTNEIIKKTLNGFAKKTAPEIYEELLAADVKGEKKSYCHCPMANYLTNKVKQPVKVAELICWQANHPDIMLPISVRTFIREFDEGKYPEMIAPKSDEAAVENQVKDNYKTMQRIIFETFDCAVFA